MTWTPAVKQNEVWTNEGSVRRVFDPAIFDNAPIFDTGQAGGYWKPRPIQAETWTVK